MLAVIFTALNAIMLLAVAAAVINLLVRASMYAAASWRECSDLRDPDVIEQLSRSDPNYWAFKQQIYGEADHPPAPDPVHIEWNK